MNLQTQPQNDPLIDKYLARGARLESDMPSEPSQETSTSDDPLIQKYLARGAQLETPGDQPAVTQTSEQTNNHSQPVMPPSISGLYRAFDSLSPERKQEMLNDTLRIAIKAPSAAAGSLLDFFSTMPLNAAVDAINGLADTDIPHAKSFQQKAEEGIDAMTGGRTKGSGHVYEGVKLATEMAIPGNIAKRLTLNALELAHKSPLIAEVLKKIGGTGSKTLAGAGAAGAAMHEAQEEGAGVVGTLASGVGGAAAVEGALSLSPKSIGKAGLRIAGEVLGVGEKNLDKKAIESGKRIKVDIPISAASDSSQVAMANQTLGHTPFLRNSIQSVKDRAHQQYREAYQNLLNEVSPELSVPFNEAVEGIYAKTNQLFRPHDKIDFSDAVKAAEDILAKTESATYSKPTIAVRKHAMDVLEFAGKDDYLLNTLKNESYFKTATSANKEKMIKALRSSQPNPENIEKMASSVLRTKIELNKIMKDKDIFTRADKDSLDLLKELQKGLRKSLSRYGNTQNKEWMQEFTKAEKEYAQIAKRRDLENLLDEVIHVEKTDSPHYGKLIDIFSKKQYKGELVNALGAEQYGKVKDFLNVAKAMHGINKRIPNPSGTAVMMLLQTAISGIGTALTTGSVSLGVSGLWGGLGVVYGLILSSPKATELAMKFAQKPSESLASQFNALLKENTGLGIQEILKYQEQDQEKSSQK